MNIFKRELLRNKKAFIIWLVILISFCAYVLALFPTMSQQADKMNELMKQMPKAFADAFNTNRLNIADILGFFGMESYLFITLLGSIYAILLGAGIISKEEDEKTIEFLLSKPVSRNHILTSKITVVVIYIVLLNLLIGIFNYFGFQSVKTASYDKKVLLLLTIAPVLLHLTFAAIGFIMSMFVVRAKSVLPASIGIVLGTYFLGVVSAMSDKAEKLKYFSPFKYVDAADLIGNKRMDDIYVFIMLAIILLSIIFTYVVYNKKDISV